MNDDDLISAALTRIAEHAPGPDSIMADLARRARMYRQRRNILVTAGALAVGAGVAGGAVLFMRRDGDRVDIAAPNLTAPGPEPSAGAGNVRVPMRYRPTWLPPDFGEVSRRSGVTGPQPRRQIRSWSPGPSREDKSQETPYVHLYTDTADWFELTGLDRTTIAGLPAWKSNVDGRNPQVVLEPEAGLRLGVAAGGMPGAAYAAFQVAASLVPDDVGGCEASLGFGWLPASLRTDPQAVQLSRVTGGWQEAYGVADGHGGDSVQASLGTSLPMISGGESVTLRDRPAVVLWDATRGYGSARLDLDRGQALLVALDVSRMGAAAPAVTRDDLLRIVAELRIGPDPYVGWMGQR